jgi:hypothetical protein
VKVYWALGGAGGKTLDPKDKDKIEKAEDGIVDLKLFAKQLKRAEDKYGLMTPEAHKQWLDAKPDGKTSAVEKAANGLKLAATDVGEAPALATLRKVLTPAGAGVPPSGKTLT